MSARTLSCARIVSTLVALGSTALLAAAAVYRPEGTAKPDVKKSESRPLLHGGNGDSHQTPAPAGSPVVIGNLAGLKSGNVPVFPVIRVDYRDDEATRLRQAGLLQGPRPTPEVQGTVAAGGCSFAVD